MFTRIVIDILWMAMGLAAIAVPMAYANDDGDVPADDRPPDVIVE